jgi:general secretion pathway protein A
MLLPIRGSGNLVHAGRPGSSARSRPARLQADKLQVMPDSQDFPMYTHFFRLIREPFSISPDPRYLFMSQRHHEALAHLTYGAGSRGGVVVLTGEIGAGKTTVCRCFLDQIPADCDVAYIFNPKLTVAELLQSICEEFHVAVPQDAARGGVKNAIDALNRHLLHAHAEGRNSMLIIDEAQNLSVEVLEQLRLLTNLETSERKLLQIVLIGQPELRDMLAQPALEQLAQRVIARYHLAALSAQETASYIQHRLTTAGLNSASPFQPQSMQRIHQLTQGVPRRINLLCDRALLGAYAQGTHEVNRRILDRAAHELFDSPVRRRTRRYLLPGMVSVALLAGAAALAMNGTMLEKVAGDALSGPLAAAGTPRAATPAPAPPPVTEAPPVTETPAAQPIVSEQHVVNLAGLDSEDAALRELAQLWGISVMDAAPCDTLEHAGLRCYRGNDGFASLRQLGRPAVLKLYDSDGKSFYAVLDGLADAGASLHAGAVSQKVSLMVLARYFRGEFVTLWRVPSGIDGSIAIGDHGPGVDWIAAQLAKLNGTEAAADGQPFGHKLQTQVREFQRAQGLLADGVVGPVTLMQLNRVAGLDEPRLRSEPATLPDVATSKE